MLSNDLAGRGRGRDMLSGMALHAGLVIVATGRYAAYVRPLLEDCAQHFLTAHQRTVFVFSDSKPPAQDGLSVVHIPTAHEPWPMPTLKRNHFFCGAEAELAHTDVLYYLDADTRIVAELADALLPDSDHELVAVRHPGFCGRYLGDGYTARALRKLGLPWPRRHWLDEPKRGSYETNPKSTAYVGPHEGKVYYMGGFYGGRTQAFLRMAHTLRDNIDRDLTQGLIAVWHDESHLNRYLIDHPPKELSPSYGYPESWDLPFEPRILLLDKDHERMRSPVSSNAQTA